MHPKAPLCVEKKHKLSPKCSVGSALLEQLLTAILAVGPNFTFVSLCFDPGLFCFAPKVPCPSYFQPKSPQPLLHGLDW